MCIININATVAERAEKLGLSVEDVVKALEYLGCSDCEMCYYMESARRVDLCAMIKHAEWLRGAAGTQPPTNEPRSDK